MPPDAVKPTPPVPAAAWGLATLQRWRLQARQAAEVLLATLELLALATTRAAYAPPRSTALAQHLLRNTWPQLPGFAVLAALLGLVLIRIVVVTAHSYGLSQYALEMVVRVLVLELLPLLAALFVALRCSLPMADEVAHRLHQTAPAAPEPGDDAALRLRWLADEVLPRALAVWFSVWLLVAVSALLTLVLAYGLVYGPTPWGWPAYTHMVGRVFTPVVLVVFAVKTLAFSLAVGVVPLASVAAQWPRRHLPPNRATELQGLVRMTGVLLVVEVLSLVGNYH